MNTALVVAIIGIGISIFTLFSSIFIFIKYDRKIKALDKILKNHQLKKIQNEKKAIIEANIIKGEKGVRKLKIYNKGKSIAKQVIVTIPDYDGIFIQNYPSPIDIRPQNSIEIIMHLSTESPYTIDIFFEWNDEYKNGNMDSQTLQLL